MSGLGFKACATVPCLYWHPDRDLLVVAHVDDFLVSGGREELSSLRLEFKRRCNCDGDILGDGKGELSENKFLGRRLIWSEGGIEWSLP